MNIFGVALRLLLLFFFFVVLIVAACRMPFLIPFVLLYAAMAGLYVSHDIKKNKKNQG